MSGWSREVVVYAWCLCDSWMFMLCVICSGLQSDVGQARCSICDYVICVCLCYVRFIPDFGLMSGGAWCSGRGTSYSGLRSDVGRGPIYARLRSDVRRGLMQWARPNMCYCMVCGSLGKLTKLRAYSFSFGFRYFQYQGEELGVIACYTPQFSAWDCLRLWYFIIYFWYNILYDILRHMTLGFLIDYGWL